MVIMEVVSCSALYRGNFLVAAVNVFVRWRGRGGTVQIFGDDARAGKDGHSRGAACNLLDAESVAIVGICAGGAAVGGAGGAALTIVNEGVDAVVGHVSA